MLRDVAVARINDGLAFRPVGNPLTPTIILRLQEAQRNLESGKTLPKFLLLEDQALLLPSGERSLALPDRFIRLDDDNLIHYTSIDTFRPVYLEYVRSYSDAVRQVTVLQRPGEPAPMTTAPKVFVIRKSTIDFISQADRDYDLMWNYYQSDEILTSNIENLWLANAPEWLIGEAGYRMAMDLRDDSSQKLFDDMRTMARLAAFADDLADADAGGPMAMGGRY